ncbi:PIG-L deacetylase family protein [Lignipirellula cremea]|uniref:GlcNAc-PI de-N-acetylase n=1 Tax=Lignipirellula cremea TaxID=2528010 RepID=A0A518DMB1_9BACT|nr:PIG-L family deacetylase [Lignipirellula cremea]QDU92963.1 GlcNAc-PI de-N-acetylase [Lignipirellula cremea]
MTHTELEFQFTQRQSDGSLRRGRTFQETFATDKPARETWLFVSPHDDDLCLGAGLLMQAAIAAGVEVQVLVVTDGCLGYCTQEQEAEIVAIRREETYASFAILGAPAEQIAYVNYPDGGLTAYCGRRRARPGESHLQGYVGLQNAFTWHLRRVRPSRVFTPTHTDLHPDHRITHSELMISIFHAAGAIWPELGPSLPAPPRVGELAVYCDFAAPPNLEIQANDAAFQQKLRSVEAYRSQTQIAALVENTRQAGPYEYVREVEFQLYSPRNYRAMFASPE